MNTPSSSSASTPAAAMSRTVERLLTRGKGMIAPDEHHDRLARALGVDRVDAVAASRHRAMVLSTPDLARWISAVVVDAEALSTGLPRPEPDRPLLGIRLGTDTGLYPYGDLAAAARRSNEMRAGLAAFRDRGIQLVKWRADLDPIIGNAHAYVDAAYLATCAALSQDVGLVPVLDLAMPNQRTHSLAVAIAVTANAVAEIYRELDAKSVDPSLAILRMNMVRAGTWHEDQTTPEEAGRATLRVLESHLPAQAPGVLFMSTGMGCDQACADLAAIAAESNRSGWDRPITFGFGRALVERATQLWVREGDDAAHEALVEDCAAAAAAASGLPIGA